MFKAELLMEDRTGCNKTKETSISSHGFGLYLYTLADIDAEHLRLSARERVDVVVWVETTIQRPLRSDETGFFFFWQTSG